MTLTSTATPTTAEPVRRRAGSLPLGLEAEGLPTVTQRDLATAVISGGIRTCVQRERRAARAADGTSIPFSLAVGHRVI